MRKNINIVIFLALAIIPIGCSICPNQLFVASGVNGNSCCSTKDLVIVTKDANGQTTVVGFPSASASPTVNPSISISPTASPAASVSPSVSPSASSTPVPSATPSPTTSPTPTATPTASPTTAIAAS